MLGGAREHVDAVLPLIRALPGLAFDRPDSTRKQDRWQTTDQVSAWARVNFTGKAAAAV